MQERTLFPHDPPGNLPHNRTATSRQAATLAKPFACRQLVRVYQFFVERGDDGATDEECQHSLNLNGDSQRPRRQWLVKNGYLNQSKNMRMTTKGRAAVVWVWSGKVLPKATAPNSAAAEQPQETSHHA